MFFDFLRLFETFRTQLLYDAVVVTTHMGRAFRAFMVEI